MVKENEYKRAVQKACKRKFGFAPSLRDIILLETASSHNIPVEVGCRIGTVGYAWRCAHDIEFAECYDEGAVK